MLRITTRDVGTTQVATVWVGEEKSIEFYTGTRHADLSREIAEQFVAGAVGEMIRNRGFVREYTEDDY